MAIAAAPRAETQAAAIAADAIHELTERRHLGTMWAAIALLLLAGFYVAIERGQSRTDRVLRWMVIVGAILLAMLIGGGALR